jgi:hypothetical protein
MNMEIEAAVNFFGAHWVIFSKNDSELGGADKLRGEGRWSQRGINLVGLAGRHLYGVVLPCYSTYQP